MFAYEPMKSYKARFVYNSCIVYFDEFKMKKDQVVNFYDSEVITGNPNVEIIKKIDFFPVKIT